MPPSNSRRMKIACLGVFVLGAQLGCFDSPGTIKRLQQEADRDRLALQRCQQAAIERESRIAELEGQIENQPRLAKVDVDDLFVVDRIKILSRSGGVDLDGEPGDDGVVVYMQPIDVEGDVIKAAGAISIQLTDLTHLGEPHLIETFEFDAPDVIRKLWYGGFMTNHYTLKCPFPESLTTVPTEVHIRIVFLDWLTGREFSESVTSKIKAAVRTE